MDTNLTTSNFITWEQEIIVSAAITDARGQLLTQGNDIYIEKMQH